MMEKVYTGQDWFFSEISLTGNLHSHPKEQRLRFSLADQGSTSVLSRPALSLGFCSDLAP